MKRYKLLIVSESLEYRIICQNFLDGDGEVSKQRKYEIIEFDNGKQALAFISMDMPELIILDYSLPDINALEFLGKLKLVSSSRLIPVIVLSTQGNEATAVEVMKNGAWDYLIKPRLTCEALNRSVSTALERLSLMLEIEQQHEKQQLLGAIALRMHQSLSLDKVLDTAVKEIRDFLKTSRVLVYQFSSNTSGKIVAESTLPQWDKLLNISLEESFFDKYNSYLYQEYNQDYHELCKQVTNDIYQSRDSKDNIDILDKFQVKANLIVPILSCDHKSGKTEITQREDSLWGLLIAHQCDKTRQWEKEEIDLLEKLSVQLAIAIRQAELYQNLQSLNNKLEVKVEQRTQKLQESERRLQSFNQELEIRVQERTNDLEQVNSQLRCEIDERQRITDELRESEIKFRQLAENIREVFFIYNHDFTELIYISPAYEEIWGLCCCDLYEYPNAWLDLVHPEDKETVLIALSEQLEEDEFKYEYRIIRKDKEIRWISVHTSLVRDENGNVNRIVGIAEDISDRKKSEIQLQQRQQEFIALVENAPDVIARIDRDLRYLYVNPAIEKAMGLPQELFLGKNYRELGFSENNFIIFEELVHLVFATGEERITELKLDGKETHRYHQVRLVPERNFQGNIASILVVSTDITSIKQTEIELRETNALLKAIIHSAPVGINLVDSEGKIVLWNPMSENIFGWSAEEIINQPLSVIEDEQVFLDNLSRSQPHEQVTQIETFRRNKDGKMVEISLSTALVRDDRGTIIGGIDITQDISDRKQVELEIIRNRDLREAIFNESADAIFLVDAKTNLTVDCNRTAVELFEAQSKQQLINIDGETLQRYKFSPEEIQVLGEEIYKKGFWSTEVEYLTLQGNIFWGNLAIKLINVARKVMYLVRVSDISEQQASLREREIREAQIQRSLEEKETLLKEIHHRVKNNLQIISSLLRMQSRRILDEKTLMLFQEAQNRVQSMALIHEQLYHSNDISQIDFGEYISSLTDNLFRCYGISNTKININIQTNGVQLNLDYAIPCGLIINELISNSLKYAFPNYKKGEINIILQLERDEKIILSVNDDGIGISNKLEWEKSNSLGLKIVRSLTRQLQGQILLETSKGTHFEIIFPYTLA